jgi:hypothetical protein
MCLCSQGESTERPEVGDKIAVFLHFHAWPKGGGQIREGHITDVYAIQQGKGVQMQAYADRNTAINISRASVMVPIAVGRAQLQAPAL